MSGMKVSQAEKAARGHWSRILPALGVNVLKNRHQPCPVCAGKDRFRFDDREGRGTWFCNQCGAGDGLTLVSKVLDVDISEAADRINGVTGNLPPVSQEILVSDAVDKEAGKQAAALLAARLLEKSRQTTGNAYLTGKGFSALSCRELTSIHKVGGVTFLAGDLIVPLYADGELVNLQLINADGGKCFLKGGQVKDAFYLVEGTTKAAKRLWIAEGYATALTINLLTGDAVMVAFSSVNFLSLASIACSQYPTHQIIIGKRLVRTVLIFTESSDQLSRATDRVPGLPASPGYVQ
ncbi:alpha replication protein of prophage CP-933I [Escherichia coli]